MKKRVGIVLFSILGVILLLGAAGFFWLNREVGAAEQKHDEVLEKYQAFLACVEMSTVTVSENGQPVGSYTLEQLGLLAQTKADVDALFTQTDRMDKQTFDALPFRQRLDWAAAAAPQTTLVPVNMQGFDATTVLQDLNALPRQAATDACIVFENAAYRIEQAVDGNELREDVVSGALQDCVSALTITDAGARNIAFELTSCDCYKVPDVTTENTELDIQAAFRQDVSALSCSVSFGEQTETLDAEQLSALVSCGEDGALQVDEAALAGVIAAWAEKYNQYDAEFIFDSYVDGPVPVEFLKVDYVLDEAALLQTLKDCLLQLSGDAFEAPIACLRDDKPFAIQDTYVEVDLTNQQLTFYKNKALIVHTDVVSGREDGHQTPKDLYYSYYKDTDCWLTGPDFHVFVKYWVSLTNLYGLHDASWRSNFGGENYVNNGSHGCVNIPEEAMKMIYDNMESGIPILVY